MARYFEGDVPTERLQVQVPVAVAAAARRQAALETRNVSQIVTLALSRYLGLPRDLSEKMGMEAQKDAS